MLVKRNLFLGAAVGILLSGYMLHHAESEITTLHDSSRYLDVDGVYETYFGDFNLSGVAREQIKTELKMIVNAVAYERANGKDLAMMTFVSERIAKRKIAEPRIREEIMRMDEFLHGHQEDEQQKQRLNASLQNSALERYTTDCTGFLDYIREQENLVETFGLPYAIPNSAIQVMDLRENRFLKVDPDKSDKHDVSDTAAAAARRLALLKNVDWQSADIILGHAAGTNERFSVQGYWNHAGLYSAGHQRIVDVWPQEGMGDSGGVRTTGLAFWAEHFSEIAVIRLKEIPLSKRRAVEERIVRRVGEPYNLTTHKMNPEGGWYCSKLIYWGYLQEDIDLDSGGGVSVLPDDIAISQGSGALQCLPKTVKLP